MRVAGTENPEIKKKHASIAFPLPCNPTVTAIVAVKRFQIKIKLAVIVSVLATNCRQWLKKGLDCVSCGFSISSHLLLD